MQRGNAGQIPPAKPGLLAGASRNSEVRNSCRLGEQQLGGKVGASHRTPQKVEAREPMPHLGSRDKFGEGPTRG